MPCEDPNAWPEDELYSLTEPISVYSIQLMNGITIQIEMHYDEKKWTLSKIPLIDDLDEFRLSFVSQKESSPTFLLRINDQLYTPFWLNCESRWANFRLGQLLKEMLAGGEGRVDSQIRRRENDDKKKLMRVTVELLDYSDLFTYRSSWLCSSYYPKWRHIGSRGVIVEERKEYVSTEILSLCSPYFLVLFYGGFKEREPKWIPLNDWIELTGVYEELGVSPIASIPLVSYEIGIIFLEFENNVVIQKLKIAVRFEMRQYLSEFKQRVLQLLQKSCSPDGINLSFLVDLADVLHTDEILVNLFDKFIDISSLDEYVEKWKESMTPEVERIIQPKLQRLEGTNRWKVPVILEFLMIPLIKVVHHLIPHILSSVNASRLLALRPTYAHLLHPQLEQFPFTAENINLVFLIDCAIQAGSLRGSRRLNYINPLWVHFQTNRNLLTRIGGRLPDRSRIEHGFVIVRRSRG